ncbi:hypothetical protein GBAR_LOCUS28795, partial [Geodia barretti]
VIASVVFETFQVKLRELGDFPTRNIIGWPGTGKKHKRITNKFFYDSVSIREVPVTTMHTLPTAAACSQIGVVGQCLPHEGDIRSLLRVDLHQGPEETEGNDHHQHRNLFYG